MHIKALLSRPVEIGLLGVDVLVGLKQEALPYRVVEASHVTHIVVIITKCNVILDR